ncbi:hypothetical protein GF318_04230 [Candidatus Micrarchaeota archaeon]|nr:hypothetical protein [Candidatus Micrarchaeota archaeon]
MKTALLLTVLLLAGAASAQPSCLRDCCEQYGGTMDEHGCSIMPGDPDFQAYTTCAGYCMAGTEPPSTSNGYQPAGDVAPPPGGDGMMGCCPPAFGLLALLGFVVSRA